MCCAIQNGHTALGHSVYFGHMTIVKYLVEKGHAVISTQDCKGLTPISAAKSRGRTNIAAYLKAQVMKMIMGIDRNIIPFYKGVRGIIAQYMF